MHQNQPRLPLPPQIMGSEIGSFAYNTVVKRLPAIAQRVIEENNFSPPILENLQTLIQEIPEGLIRPLKDTAAPDIDAWNNYVEPYQGKNWLDIPWFFAETYFYRRILEATNYFIPGIWQNVDPFEAQKNLGITTSIQSIQALSALVNQWISHKNRENLIALLYIALWGNRVDLSLWPAQEGDRSIIDIQRETAYILADDTCAIANKLIQENKSKAGETPTPQEIWSKSNKLTDAENLRIDFVIDNAGFELFGDFCLVDYLLATNTAKTIYLHLKAHPTFVSDAMIKDIHKTIEVLKLDNDPQVQKLASRLEGYIKSDRIQLCQDLFWTSPLAFWEMPEHLRQQLAQSNLTFIKGDANYRRLLGDRHWDYTTPFEEIVCYFPCPMAALRTLKAELAAGLQLEQITTLNQQDPDWLTNGRWGVIQGNFRF